MTDKAVDGLLRYMLTVDTKIYEKLVLIMSIARMRLAACSTEMELLVLIVMDSKR